MDNPSRPPQRVYWVKDPSLVLEIPTLDLRDTVVRTVSTPRTLQPTVWNDSFLTALTDHDRPPCSVPHLIGLGENLVIMLSQGPIHNLEKTVCTLALNLYRADGEHMFPEHPIGNNHVLQPATTAAFLAKMNTVTRRLTEEPVQEQEDPGNRAGAAAEADTNTVEALTAFFRKMRPQTQEVQARFYCFLAAVLCRITTKPPKTVRNHMVSVPGRFATLYGLPEVGVRLPTFSIQMLEALAIPLKAGSSLIQNIVKAFVFKRYADPDLIVDNKGILDYTFLLHTSYTGMALVPLCKKASFELFHTQDIKLLFRHLEAASTSDGMEAVIDYINNYSAGGANYPGHAAPWCRVVHPKYWCNLALKCHTELGALLTAICADESGTIYNMAGITASDATNVLAQQIVASSRHSHL